MKKASIVSIGNELLNGRTTDTNTTYLSGKLLSVGIAVITGYTVGDDIDLIARALQSACTDADIVLVTGGLGPTDDDLTRQGCAKFLGAELRLKDDLLKKIQTFFTNRNLQIPRINEVQAYIPAGAESLNNDLGTAPGIWAEKAGKIIACMPGVPSEMKAMFEDSVLPKLKAMNSDYAIVTRRLNCFGAGESAICQMIGDMMQRDRNPLINCTVKEAVITLHIIASAGNAAKAEEMVKKDEESLRDKLGELIYGIDEQSLAETAGRQLARLKKTLAVAESCTGGLIAKMLTDVPGSSEYFIQGWVTYSNDAKTRELAVPAELIKEYGAVSEQVAFAMATNARKNADSDFAIAVTGIAGPSGGTQTKPAGLVYISVDDAHGCETRRFVFGGDRKSVRIRAAQTTLNILRLLTK